jgi:hypothetical protein
MVGPVTLPSRLLARQARSSTRLLFALGILVATAGGTFLACSDDSAGGPGTSDASVDAIAPSDVAPLPPSDGGSTPDGGGNGADCRPSGWCWENPKPWGDTVAGVWGAAPNDVWAVGGAGVLFHWDGTAWSRVASPTTTNLYAVWGAAPNDVWAVGDHGTVLHYDGSSWTSERREDGGSYDPLVAIHGTSGTDVWAIGSQGALHYDGVGWTTKTLFDADGGAPLFGQWNDIFDHGTNDVWVAGGLSGSLAHADGAAWDVVTIDVPGIDPSTVSHCVWVAPNGDLFVGADQGIFGPENARIYRRSGGTWTESPVTLGTISRIWGTTASDVYAIGTGGTILHFDGATWAAAAGAPTNAPHLGGIAPAGGDLWVVGDDATFLRRTAAAPGTWATTLPTSASTTQNLTDVSALSAAEAWAVGQTVLHRTDQGWAVASALEGGGTLDDAGLQGVSAISSTDVWAGGNRGAFHWNGSAWSPRNALADGGLLAGLSDISAAATDDVWGVSGSSVFHYLGSTWSEVPLTQADGGPVTTGPFFFTVVARTPNDVWVGGPFTVLRWNGGSWTKVNDADSGLTGPASGILPVSDTEGWAVTGFAQVAYHWNGTNLVPVPIPGDWSDSLFLPRMAASSPTDIWLVAPGGIAHYNGQSWSYSDRPSSTMQGIGSAAGHTWVVGTGGTILHHAPTQ